jgi:hypothetical protein
MKITAANAALVLRKLAVTLREDDGLAASEDERRTGAVMQAACLAGATALEEPTGEAREREFVRAFCIWWASGPEVGIDEEPDELLGRFLALHLATRREDARKEEG